MCRQSMKSKRYPTHAVLRTQKKYWAVEVTFIETDGLVTTQGVQWSSVKRSTITAERVLNRLKEAIEDAGVTMPTTMYINADSIPSGKQFDDLLEDWDSFNLPTGYTLL